MSNLILPGFIDPHVHLRDPGQTQKEDFYTGTCAALAGGYTTVLDMPNNKVPITTLARLEEKIAIAKKKIVCDVGFYFGSLGDNLDEFDKVKDKVVGLKLYLNRTTGNFLINKDILEKTIKAWHKNIPSITTTLQCVVVTTKTKPVLVHAEGKMLENVINLVRKIRIPTHFCHISLASELAVIINAKEQGIPVTCGVTPHHLFLTDHDAKVLGAFGQMKPQLSSKKDQDFLWKNLKYIDVIESDHAPHTITEKNIKKKQKSRGESWHEKHSSLESLKATVPRGPMNIGPQGRLRLKNFRTDETTSARQDSQIAPFGVPGLETTLPLLLTAVSEKRLAMEDIMRLCFENPSRIFCSSKNCDAKIEFDLYKSYTIENKNLFTKCRWSPFDGMRVKGKVKRVFIRGKKVFENDRILVKPGFGKII